MFLASQIPIVLDLAIQSSDLPNWKFVFLKVQEAQMPVCLSTAGVGRRLEPFSWSRGAPVLF